MREGLGRFFSQTVVRLWQLPQRKESSLSVGCCGEKHRGKAPGASDLNKDLVKTLGCEHQILQHGIQGTWQLAGGEFTQISKEHWRNASLSA